MQSFFKVKITLDICPMVSANLTGHLKIFNYEVLLLIWVF